MPNNVDDLPLLQQPIPLATDGAQAVVNYWENASIEVRNLISNECNLVFECRECRNMFRSIVNFISHKRVSCRSLLDVPGPSSSEVQQIAEKVMAETDSASNSCHSGSSDPNDVPVRKRAFLRRTNIVNAISKRAEHYSKKLPESKLFVTTPKDMAEKEPVPSDKVTLVLPQDHSIKYREMNLRRRENDPKIAPARFAAFDERLLADRLTNHPDLADAGLLTCTHSDCTEKQPFSSLYTLAYHITIRHNRRFFPQKKNFCFVCGEFFESYTSTVTHLKKQHGKYYEEHRSHRTTASDEKAESRKRKRKISEKGASSEHSGSLSPVSDYSEECDSATTLCRFEYDFKKCNALDAL